MTCLGRSAPPRHTKPAGCRFRRFARASRRIHRRCELCSRPLPRRSPMLRSFASPLLTKVCAGGGLALLLLAGCAQGGGVIRDNGTGGSGQTGGSGGSTGTGRFGPAHRWSDRSRRHLGNGWDDRDRRNDRDGRDDRQGLGTDRERVGRRRRAARQAPAGRRRRAGRREQAGRPATRRDDRAGRHDGHRRHDRDGRDDRDGRHHGHRRTTGATCGAGDSNMPAQPTLPSSVCTTLSATKNVAANGVPSESSADTSAIQAALTGCGSARRSSW